VALDLRREGIRILEAEVEDAVSVAASVLTHLRRERLPFRLVCADGAGAVTELGSGEASFWEAMRLLAMARADGGRRLSEVVLAQKGGLGESVVLISRTRDDELPECVRKLRSAGVSVVVVALATHTYRTMAQGRDAELMQRVDRLDAAGAAVRVVEHPEGVAGLSGARRRTG
jgi:hypothetical protein